MTARHFRQGELLFSEGDSVDGVLRVLSGRVEISRQRHGIDIVLGGVSSGQFLGEMGVIEGRPRRGATARAATDVEAELIAPAQFLDLISRTPDAARDLIQRLSQRLHAADDRIVADEQRGSPDLERDLGEGGAVEGLSLAAATRKLRRQIKRCIAVEVPFVVGREVLPGEPPAPLKLDLALRDRPPLRLSRAHFAVVRRQDQLFVRDLHSTLGTMVNGAPIGWHFGADEAPLRPGDNVVVAGGVGSEFAFSLSVADQGRIAQDDAPDHSLALNETAGA